MVHFIDSFVCCDSNSILRVNFHMWFVRSVEESGVEAALFRF